MAAAVAAAEPEADEKKNRRELHVSLVDRGDRTPIAPQLPKPVSVYSNPLSPWPNDPFFDSGIRTYGDDMKKYRRLIFQFDIETLTSFTLPFAPIDS